MARGPLLSGRTTGEIGHDQEVLCSLRNVTGFRVIYDARKLSSRRRQALFTYFVRSIDDRVSNKDTRGPLILRLVLPIQNYSGRVTSHTCPSPFPRIAPWLSRMGFCPSIFLRSSTPSLRLEETKSLQSLRLFRANGLSGSNGFCPSVSLRAKP